MFGIVTLVLPVWLLVHTATCIPLKAEMVEDSTTTLNERSFISFLNPFDDLVSAILKASPKTTPTSAPRQYPCI
jgi:hypothetical protein